MDRRAMLALGAACAAAAPTGSSAGGEDRPSSPNDRAPTVVKLIAIYDSPDDPIALSHSEEAGRIGRILWVEDNDDVREAGRHVLEHLGHSVIVARNAQEGLDALRAGTRIDLLLTDLVMPGGMSGLDLARHARMLRPHLPVLLTSGYSADLEGVAEARQFAFIPKPFEPDGLARQIDALLPLRGSRG